MQHFIILGMAWPKWEYKLTQKYASEKVFVAPNANVDATVKFGHGSGAWYGSKVTGNDIYMYTQTYVSLIL